MKKILKEWGNYICLISGFFWPTLCLNNVSKRNVESTHNNFHTQRLKVYSVIVWIPSLIQHSGFAQSCRILSKISTEVVPDGNYNLSSHSYSFSVSWQYIWFLTFFCPLFYQWETAIRDVIFNFLGWTLHNIWANAELDIISPTPPSILKESGVLLSVLCSIFQMISTNIHTTPHTPPF